MRLLQRVIRNTMLMAAISMLLLPLTASGDIQIESKVIFNTNCARCHEGECSGRLTFHLQNNAVDQHIIRHGGDELSLATIRQLSEVLHYMKEKCSFYPMTVDVKLNGIYSKKRLDKLKSPAGNAYFVPLGSLEAGSYQLILEVTGVDSGYCMEIISATFSHIEKRIINNSKEKLIVQFNVDEQSEFYLRLRSQSPLNLNKLELLAIESKNANN